MRVPVAGGPRRQRRLCMVSKAGRRRSAASCSKASKKSLHVSSAQRAALMSLSSAILMRTSPRIESADAWLGLGVGGLGLGLGFGPTSQKPLAAWSVRVRVRA